MSATKNMLAAVLVGMVGQQVTEVRATQVLILNEHKKKKTATNTAKKVKVAAQVKTAKATKQQVTAKASKEVEGIIPVGAGAGLEAVAQAAGNAANAGADVIIAALKSDYQSHCCGCCPAGKITSPDGAEMSCADAKSAYVTSRAGLEAAGADLSKYPAELTC
ncbi:unnamed protein product [Amoebophrya sp. A120]|nr:unnamed protein product [Amoebophrya sp. A120]|eukprot:GSA120T00001376001.1